MKKQKFTLVELITVITVLSILLAIILVQLSDLKKKSVYSAVSSNVKIIQSAVDAYHLKYEKYPIKKELTVSNGQLIDIDNLIEKGLLKKDLDVSKIKNQYYWVDVFGRVWGNTELPPKSINVIEKIDKRIFEFTLNEKVSKYNIYEVSGYKNGENLSYNKFKIQKPENNVALADSERYYRLVKEVEVSISEPTNFIFEGTNKNSTYLISIEDDYGLESIPVGLTENKFFTPLINFEGTREYEIEGSQQMFWVDYITAHKIPSGSSITYQFKVKDENGVYGEYVDDFYSLPPSKGIVIQVKMTANSKNEKPSLYSLEVLYNYGGKEKTTLLVNPPLVTPIEELNPISPSDSIISKGNGSTGSGSNPNDGSNSGETGSETGGDSGSSEGGIGSPIGGGSSSGIIIGGSTSNVNPVNVCPAGYAVTNIRSNGTSIDSSKEKQLSYLIVLNDEEAIESITEPTLDNGTIIDTVIEYSPIEGEGNYSNTDSIRGIPQGSCVSISYVLNTTGSLSILVPPAIKLTKPLPKQEEELQEWTTIEKLKFTSNSVSGEKVKWTDFIKEDHTPENTRIVYTFSALDQYDSWTGELENISDLPKSSKVIVYAKLQVRTTELGKEEQEEPSLLKAKLVYDNSKEVELIGNPENISDVFYPALVEDSIITNNWFDSDRSTYSEIKSNQQVLIKWKNEKLAVNKAVEIHFNSNRRLIGSANTSYATVSILNKEGQEIKFLGYSNLENNYSYVNSHLEAASNKINVLRFVIPENADTIVVTGYSPNNTYGPEIHDMKFTNLSSEPEDLINIKAKPTDTKVTFSWNKPANVEEIEIYRGDTRIGISKGETFTDPATLSAETEYSYSFLIRDSYGNVKYLYDKSKFIVNTKSKAVLFYPMDDSDKASTATWFDENHSTGAATKLKGATTFIKWKVDPDYYNGTLENKAVKINFKSYNTGNSTLNVSVYDKNGGVLPFYTETSSRFVKVNSKSLSVTNGTAFIDFVLPANADRIGVSGTTLNYTFGPSIMNIDFVNLLSEPDAVSNFTANPSTNNITLNWDKPNNVTAVDVYRDNVFVGRTTNNTFTGSEILISEETYSYHFIYKDASGNIKMAYLNQGLKVKTLSKPISFYAMNSADKATTSAWFDGNNSTSMRTKDRGASTFVKWKVDPTLYPESLTNKTVRVLFQPYLTRNSTLTISIRDISGNIILTKSLSAQNSAGLLDFVIPANADNIEVKGTTVSNIYGPSILEFIVLNP